MKQDAKPFNVTIIRPKADEVAEEARIGFAQLAKVIAQCIRDEERMKESTTPNMLMIDLVQGSKED